MRAYLHIVCVILLFCSVGLSVPINGFSDELFQEEADSEILAMQELAALYASQRNKTMERPFVVQEASIFEVPRMQKGGCAKCTCENTMLAVAFCIAVMRDDICS